MSNSDIARQHDPFTYRRRIDRAVRYALTHLDQPIQLDDLAEVACFSKFHFHRVFTALMNEAPGEYITRKRMERAAIRLIYANASVTALSEEYGYGSIAAFSKAFRHWFGCRPTALKAIQERLEANDGRLQTRHGKVLDAQELFVPVSGAADPARRATIEQRVEVRRVDGFDVHYRPGTRGYHIDGVWETWAALRKQLGSLADEANCEWFALSHDHPGLSPGGQCRYDAGVALPSGTGSALPLPVTRVPGGGYAVYPVDGPEASILKQYLEFYSLWMPYSGFEPADFPIVEHYLPGCRPGHIRVELWVRLRPLLTP